MQSAAHAVCVTRTDRSSNKLAVIFVLCGFQVWRQLRVVLAPNTPSSGPVTSFGWNSWRSVATHWALERMLFKGHVWHLLLDRSLLHCNQYETDFNGF